jgi:hypothetical protein
MSIAYRFQGFGGIGVEVAILAAEGALIAIEVLL